MTENLIVEIVKSTPPITRLIAIAIFTICFLVYTEMLSPYKITFSRTYLHRLELHRAFTSFFYFGSPNLDTILHIIFLIRYSKMLEESFINMCDYAYFLLIVQALIFSTALVWNVMVLGPVFSSVITYVWTRKNPSVQIQLFGCFIFPAFYLPFILPLFSLVSERKILKNEVLGIFVGHFYYFFKFVFPKFGYDPLRTPVFFQKAFGEYEEKKELPVREENKVLTEESNIEGPCLPLQKNEEPTKIENSAVYIEGPRLPLQKNEEPTKIENSAVYIENHRLESVEVSEDSITSGNAAKDIPEGVPLHNLEPATSKDYSVTNRSDSAVLESELYERSISYEMENSTFKEIHADINEGSALNIDSYWDIKIKQNSPSAPEEDESSNFDVSEEGPY